jgi:MoaA/NifB/PqqE/SkfB family radical SAM enzyme
MNKLVDFDQKYQSRQLIIKPTSACNFNCTFCSSKNLNIPIHNKVPDKIKDYINNYKPTNIIITGGEPLMNPRSYFEDLIHIMDSLNNPYTISLTSNLVLWYKNPEKWDWLFTKNNISVDTSFQYGEGRKDVSVYTEERFKQLFYAFKNRYNKILDFISVLSEENEQYAIKTVQLAKELNSWVKLNCQIPVGKALTYYPRYKLFNIYLQLIKLGLDKYEGNLINRRQYYCPFTKTYKYCLLNKVIYIDNKNELIEGNCEEVISSNHTIQIEKNILFPKCLGCKMYNICNSCSINREYTRPIKEEHCKWMKDHYNDLLDNNLIY